MKFFPLVSRSRVFAPAFFLALAGLACDATAQSRWVYINGKRLNDAQVAELARRNCSFIPDGSYWMNMRTGAWGYAGNAQVQGVLGDPCRQGTVAAGRQLHLGPYATMRRANEVANQYRSQGFRAVAFHNGDGYYVNATR